MKLMNGYKPQNYSQHKKGSPYSPSYGVLPKGDTMPSWCNPLGTQAAKRKGE